MSIPHSIDQAKQQARDMRAEAKLSGAPISHAQALEAVAHQSGFRDWNNLHTHLGNQPPIDWELGGLVEGKYLSQPFEAQIIKIAQISPGWHRITFELDEPIDVVTFDSFSHYRRRITTTIGPLGETVYKTSDGVPQMVVRPMAG